MYYKEVTSAEELEAIVKEMVAFARMQPPFNQGKLIDKLKENDTSIKEYHDGSVIRVRSKEILPELEQYTRLLELASQPIQLCYFEMDVKDIGRVGQMTIADNIKEPLNDTLIAALTIMFFNNINDVVFIPTEHYVAIGIAKIDPNR
jgi:hypothetical protein